MIKPNKNLSTIFSFLVNRFAKINNLGASLWQRGRCIFCHGLTSNRQKVCPGCLLDLVWNTHSCPICAEPSATKSGEACGQCQASPPAFDKVIAPLIYQFPIAVCIQRFKYLGQRRYANVFCDLMTYSESLTTNDQHSRVASLKHDERCIIAVPMARSQQKKRNYNHSELLAKKLSSRLNIAVRLDIISKHKETSSQAGLKRIERLKNLKGSFSFTTNPCPVPKHVTLIDDVVTTGATAHTIAQLLKENGVETVEIWALARTPKN